MKLGTQVGLSPGHIVLGGDPAAPPVILNFVALEEQIILVKTISQSV